MKTVPHSQAVVHHGVDVAKAELVIDCDGSIKRFGNHAKGIAGLLAAAGKSEGIPHLVCEATGGYEQAMAQAALRAGMRVSVVPPQRVRNFAKSLGRIAKSDPIDAKVITRFGQVTNPEPLQAKDSGRQKLDELLRARVELLDSQQRERNRLEHHSDPAILRMFKALITRLEKQIATIDERCAALIDADSTLSRADALLREVACVGPQVSRTLLAFLPELGYVGRRAIAALTGLAPYDRDSGKMQGKRFIQGGRAQVRRVLYMAAIVATRHNPVLRDFYQRLRSEGKAGKVAVVAVARKLIVHLNTKMANLLKNPIAV